jgi:hypothetical protein
MVLSATHCPFEFSGIHSSAPFLTRKRVSAVGQSPSCLARQAVGLFGSSKGGVSHRESKLRVSSLQEAPTEPELLRSTKWVQCLWEPWAKASLNVCVCVKSKALQRSRAISPEGLRSLCAQVHEASVNTYASSLPLVAFQPLV